jgi:hypothetical protein
VFKIAIGFVLSFVIAARCLCFGIPNAVKQSEVANG